MDKINNMHHSDTRQMHTKWNIFTSNCLLNTVRKLTQKTGKTVQYTSRNQKPSSGECYTTRNFNVNSCRNIINIVTFSTINDCNKKYKQHLLTI